jgi:uncharacterized membrane protein
MLVAFTRDRSILNFPYWFKYPGEEMMQASDNSHTVVVCAVTSILALGCIAATHSADAAEYEKCAGIAAAGKNDCGTSVSSCAGTAKQDRDTHAWVLVPKGTCSKIAGGTVTTDPMAMHGGGVFK